MTQNIAAALAGITLITHMQWSIAVDHSIAEGCSPCRWEEVTASNLLKMDLVRSYQHHDSWIVAGASSLVLEQLDILLLRPVWDCRKTVMCQTRLICRADKRRMAMS